MTVAALIEELTYLGVTLTPEGDRLRYRGPAAVITPELKERIVKQKAEIIVTLTQAGEYGPGRPSLENAARSLAVAQEIRQDLVWKRAGYEKQMAWIGRIVELLDAAIKEQNSQIKWLKG